MKRGIMVITRERWEQMGPLIHHLCSTRESIGPFDMQKIYSSKVCIHCARIAIGCTIIQTLDEQIFGEVEVLNSLTANITILFITKFKELLQSSLIRSFLVIRRFSQPGCPNYPKISSPFQKCSLRKELSNYVSGSSVRQLVTDIN